MSSFHSPLNNWPIEIFILEIKFTIRFVVVSFLFFSTISLTLAIIHIILYSIVNIFFYVYINLWTSIATYLDSPLLVLSGLIIHMLGRGLLVELVQHGRYKFAVNCIEVEEIMAERMIDSKAWCIVSFELVNLTAPREQTLLWETNSPRSDRFRGYF